MQITLICAQIYSFFMQISFPYMQIYPANTKMRHICTKINYANMQIYPANTKIKIFCMKIDLANMKITSINMKMKQNNTIIKHYLLNILAGSNVSIRFSLIISLTTPMKAG